MNNLKCTVLALTMGASLFIGGKAFAQVPNYVPTNGLLGWWPFNGNANDESGSGNNGTVNGATLTTDRFGVSNKAYLFQNFPNSIDLPELSTQLGSPNSSMTISLWFNTGNLNGNEGILFHSSQSNQFIFGRVAVNNNGNTLKIYHRNPTSNNEPAAVVTQTNNTWSHLIIIIDGSVGTYRLYLNNVLVPSMSFNYNPSESYFGAGRIWNIGAIPVGYPSDHQFVGKIDDVGVWNRALSDQEISILNNPNSCANDLTISPILNTQNIGGDATFTATTTDSNPTYTWQSDFGQGFQTLNNYGNYSGANTNTLTISNLQLANQNQPIRAISTSGNCISTSNIVSIQITDTCITNVTVYDTLLTTVTDTLIINTTLSLPAPNNENTILIYPNPISDHITIDNGNFAAMAGYSIKIENNAGQQVFQSAIDQQQFYVDLSTWTGNGLYFVHLIDAQNNTVTVRKIVLQ